jgi:calcineurin-like phosphoesterase family protein
MGGYFFTGDQHFGHANIIRFCGRPFASVEEMDAEIIRRHNEAVGPEDTVVHAGDFHFRGARAAQSYLNDLNGYHIFVRGNHDRWMDSDVPHIRELRIEGTHLVVCHYAMRVWPRSHHGSWQLHGHSHGALEPVGLQWDVGVDNNDFRPVPFDGLAKIMADLES